MPNPSDDSDIDISALRRTPHKPDPNFADISNVRRGSSLTNQVTLTILHGGAKRPLISSTTVMDKFSRRWIPNNPEALTLYQAQLAANKLQGGIELGTLTFGLLASSAPLTVDKFQSQIGAFTDSVIEKKTQGLLFRSSSPVEHAVPESTKVALTTGTMIWANPASNTYREHEIETGSGEIRKILIADSPATIYIVTDDMKQVSGNYSVFGKLIGGTMNNEVLDLMASETGGPRTSRKKAAQERLQEAKAELERLANQLQIAQVERRNLELAMGNEETSPGAGFIRRERFKEFWDKAMADRDRERVRHRPGRVADSYPFALLAKGLARKWVEHVRMTKSEQKELADALDKVIEETEQAHSAVKSQYDKLDAEVKSIAHTCGPNHQSPICPDCGKMLLSIIAGGDKVGSITKA